MKIIILSSYSYTIKVNNYGSILQYFALQTYLQRKGHDIRWLKYEANKKMPTGLNRWLREFFLHSYFKTDNVEFHNKKGFFTFIDKYIHLTKHTYHDQKSLNACPPKADMYIVGSDQVWNGYSPDRFLMFVPKHIPKISYAVSFGKNAVPKYMRPLLKYYLRSFKAVSVRETEGVELCKALGRSDAKYTIDPSFLLRREEYISIIEKDGTIPAINASYIYGYFVNPFPNDLLTHKTGIDEYIKLSGKKFFVTGIQNAEQALKEYDMIQPSPLEWINTILHADGILTNSFHGVAYSINLQRPFLLLLQTGDMSNQNCRYLNLINKLGLENRIYHPAKGSMKEQMECFIDWESVNKKREAFIASSEEYLSDAINSITY